MGRQSRYVLNDHTPDNEAIEIRSVNGEFNYEQIIYRRSSNSHERNLENGLSVIFNRIMKKWKRSNSIHPAIKDVSCSICLSSFTEGKSVIQLR